MTARVGVNIHQGRIDSPILTNLIGDETNAFPFHPHKPGKIQSKRKPGSPEIEEGKRYLKLVYELFRPKELCSLGRVGQKILKEVFPDKKVDYIRHPSYGGKKDFIKGMQKIL